MYVPRHVWWRDERANVATTGTLTGDVAGSAAPPILTLCRRAIHHGAAGIDLNACDGKPATLLKQQQKQPAHKL